MNALVKKEIRLLLPSWLTVLSLAIFLPWIWKPNGSVISWSPIVFFFGSILIGVDSFGREFSLGTFSWLMSQPVERHKIWRNKIAVLAVGVAIIYIVQFASYELWLHWGVTLFARGRSYTYNTLGDDWWFWVTVTAALMLVATCGGLWTTLLLRQVAAALWITFLAPVGLVLLMVSLLLRMFPSTPERVAEGVFLGLAGIYIVAGFLVARGLFYRAQDVGWSGGVITLPEWRGLAARSGEAISSRKRRPMFALLKKEFQLQQAALMGAAGLLVLHIGVIFLREYHEFAKDSLGLDLARVFWVLWLVMAPMVGGMAVAEERRLGVMEGQLCLPVSRQVQFAIKLVLTMLLGAFLGGVMPMLVERVAAEFGSQNSMFTPEAGIGGEFGVLGFEWAIVALATWLTFVSFYASTLARSFLQALGLAVATFAGWVLIATWIVNTRSFFGIVPLSSPILEAIVAVPTVVVTLLWLGYLNFTNSQSGWPLWRRNLMGMMGAVLFILVASALIYHRAWEVFELAEPPHGTPKFSLSNPPALQGDASGSLLVRLPDGRVWFDSLGYPFLSDGRRDRWKEAWWVLVRPLPESDGPGQFLADSNWVSVAVRHITGKSPGGSISGSFVGYWDTVGIRADGTLWSSSDAKPTPGAGTRMIRLDDETNWKRVVRMGPGFLLLKTDGSLWEWGASRFDWSLEQNSWPYWPSWPSVRISKPQPIGTSSDWTEIFSDGTGYARKTDGSIWAVHVDWKDGKDELKRRANLDPMVPQTFSRMGDDRMAYVGRDGTLWVGDRSFDESKKRWEGSGSFVQEGKETNWVAVAVAWNSGVALKADGTLWKWTISDSVAEVAGTRPTRLGIHNDWVSVTVSRTAVVSLAADGSVWYWPNTGFDEGVLLKSPKQPQLLGNVFSDTR